MCVCVHAFVVICMCSSCSGYNSHIQKSSYIMVCGMEPLHKSGSVCMYVESSWNVMAHGNAQEGKWRGNWRMEWVAGTLHTTLEHGVSSITTADAHNSAASIRLNWWPRRFKWTRLFCRKMKSCCGACAITFQMQSKYWRFDQVGCM